MGDAMKYIKRSCEGIEISSYRIDTIRVGFTSYIDRLCKKNGSSLKGRITSAKYILNRHRMVPIYVNENIILLLTKDIRHIETVAINCMRVISFSQKEDNTLVTFDDLTSILLKTTIKKIKKQYKMGMILHHSLFF
jgi:competence transcription factor ComK